MGPERSDDTLSRDDGVSDFGTITTISESPRAGGRCSTSAPTTATCR